MESAPQPARPTVPSHSQKGPLDHLYINPNVTRPAQRELAKKLHAEIATEKELDKAFKNRPAPTRPIQCKPAAKRPGDAAAEKDGDKAAKKPEVVVEDNAKIFNDFCKKFLETCDSTKERVTQVLDDEHTRITELGDLQVRLEEIERHNYQFEMDLPDAPKSIEAEIDHAVAEGAGDLRKKKEKM